MRYRLLGPLEILGDGHPVRLAGPRQEKVAAALLLEPNRVVPVDRLVDVVWDSAPPVHAVKQVRNCVSVVRAALTRAGLPAALGTTGAGYRFCVGDDELDTLVLDGHLSQARRLLDEGRAEHASARLGEAVSLWRGPALAGLRSRTLLPAIAHLHERRLFTVEWHAEVELALGRHAHLVGRLTELVAEHPLREQLVAYLMLALYRSGRRADALAAYHRLRAELDAELAVNPGKRVTDLHERILRADPTLDATLAAAVRLAAPGRQGAPRQLPPAVGHFTGRAAALEALTSLLDRSTEAHAPVVISAIGGTAGIGKTALALFWAHRVADRFPDGQLYVNLRGFDPSGRPATPGEALRGFLDALAVPTDQIPSTVDGQAALYRTLLAGRRVLVVLDNACDADQVRPLLPGGPSSLAVVTSRAPLTSLVAAEGAYPLTLDLLTDAEAHDLLARRLGASRLTGAAPAELIRLCARLPLALSIAAAHAATHPSLPLADLVDQLHAPPGRLDQLTAGDPLTDVRAVLSWSYRSLTPPAARAFRLLGLHPGPDISLAATASLIGTAPPAAHAALAELTSAHMLTEPLPGRYTFHDLLRAYAAEQARAQESPQRRRAAVHRALDHYLHSLHSAVARQPTRDPIDVPAASASVTPEDLSDDTTASAWCETEQPVLLALIELTAAGGFDRFAWQLPWTLATFFNRQGRWQEMAASQRIALDAARRLGDADAQARTHRDLGHAYLRLGSYTEAHRHLGDALCLYERLRDVNGQARVHHSLTLIAERGHRYDMAIEHAQQALALYESAGNRAGQAAALNAVGWYHALREHYPAALDQCRRALALHQELAHRPGEAATWDSLGYIHHRLGEHPRALHCYHQALHRYRELGDRYLEAEVLTHIGDTHEAAGQPDAARTTRRDALTILDELRHPDAATLRAALREADPVIPGR